eukprot:s825_g5.t1
MRCMSLLLLSLLVLAISILAAMLVVKTSTEDTTISHLAAAVGQGAGSLFWTLVSKSLSTGSSVGGTLNRATWGVWLAEIQARLPGSTRDFSTSTAVMCMTLVVLATYALYSAVRGGSRLSHAAAAVSGCIVAKAIARVCY